MESSRHLDTMTFCSTEAMHAFMHVPQVDEVKHSIMNILKLKYLLSEKTIVPTANHKVMQG